MKPATVEDSDLPSLRYPLIAQPKIDGIRVFKYNGCALTASMKAVPNLFIRQQIELYCPDGYDGEIWWPGCTFKDVQTAVMTHYGSPRFEWHVFDLAIPGWTAKERNEILSSYHQQPDFIRIITSSTAYTIQSLAALELVYLANQFEGIILRDPNAQYKFGRSTLDEQCLLRRKPFVDAEAEIIDFKEKMHNYNEAYIDERGRTKRSSAQGGKIPLGVLGAFVLHHPKFGTFDCGSGLDHQQQHDYWLARESLLGHYVTFKYQVNHCAGKPCPAVFKALRS